MTTSSTILDRKAFFGVLAKQVDHANTYKVKLALLIVDIDRFYKINQTFGYGVGDKILSKFALLLKSAVRPQDYVAKIGDNRFALILTGIMNVGHAELAAHKIKRLLEVPFTQDDKNITVDCSIAISLCPTHASHYVSLLKECESVLHDAKHDKAKLRISQIPEEDELSEDWDIEIALEDALDNDQLTIYYQPKIAINTGRVIGAEALLRWYHPIKGFVSPVYFIPIAERMGYMKDITNWIFNTSLRHGSEWCEKYGPLSVSVNVPPDLVLSPDLTDQIANAMSLWGKADIQLTIEIIERSLVLEPERSFAILKSLQDDGIKVSVDDFGTGYSSLSYFESLPVDELKIDRSFVSRVTDSEKSRNIVKLIVDLAHAFNLQVVAEGVEKNEELQYLKTIGCDVVQGYYYAKPMPQKKLMEWFASFGMNK